MPEVLVKALLEQTGLWVLGISVLVGVVWNAAVSYTNLKYMRVNMVTHKDLEISMLQQCDHIQEWADKRFVTRREQAAQAGD